MKWITVQEYALLEEICLAAAYKRVKNNQVTWQKKFNKIIIKYKDKELV